MTADSLMVLIQLRVTLVQSYIITYTCQSFLM